MADAALHLIIGGRVQGVGYRAWVAEEAASRGLSGWVRNRRDGSVEALVAGDAGVVEEFLERCRDGPRAASVSSVTSESYDGPLPRGFTVRPTA